MGYNFNVVIAKGKSALLWCHLVIPAASGLIASTTGALQRATLLPLQYLPKEGKGQAAHIRSLIHQVLLNLSSPAKEKIMGLVIKVAFSKNLIKNHT